MFKHLGVIALGAILAASAPFAVQAANYDVKMVNKGADGHIMEFDPPFLQIQPGDTVTFVPTDKGHSSISLPGMIPDGATPWQGQISQKITVTLTKPGVYGYKCLPHFGLGMVGLIEVGTNPPNLAAAEKVSLPPLAAKKMKQLFAEVK